MNKIDLAEFVENEPSLKAVGENEIEIVQENIHVDGTVGIDVGLVIGVMDYKYIEGKPHSILVDYYGPLNIQVSN